MEPVIHYLHCIEAVCLEISFSLLHYDLGLLSEMEASAGSLHHTRCAVASPVSDKPGFIPLTISSRPSLDLWWPPVLAYAHPSDDRIRPADEGYNQTREAQSNYEQYQSSVSASSPFRAFSTS